MKYVLIPLLPLIAFAINILFGRKYIKDKAHWVSVPAVIMSFILAVGAFMDVKAGKVININLYDWIVSGNFNVTIGFLIDRLTVVMLLVVTSISSLIFIYSVGYMRGDKGYYRFFAYLSLFVFSMLILVMANNFLLLYFGWEAVGLCSYFLIGFWFDRKSAANAGKKAFVVNRFGDFGFGLGIILIFLTFGSLEYLQVFPGAHSIVGQTLNIFGHEVDTITVICLLLFCGAVGKSAQIPLHVWLPDAMEGPTPVSALIHAATMVTAGVFMVARCNPLFVLSPVAMNTVAVVGGVTAIFAATIALVQNDIKRVIAYSTVSQLGYMFLALGMGAFSAAIFHLYTHAYFKALLFLASGSVIHALHHAKHDDEQNMQKMGGLRKYMPITYLVFILATLSITGIPGLAGFFSKDEILWRAYMGGNLGKFLWFLGTTAALLTAFYSWRLIYMTFHGKFRGTQESERHLRESSPVITVPLMFLAVGAVAAGWVGIPPLFMEHGDRIGAFLAPVLGHSEGHGTHAEEFMVLGASIAVALGGWFIAHRMYIKRPELPQKIMDKFQPVHRLLFNKYWVDELYDKTIVQPLLKGSEKVILGIVDAKIIEGVVNGVPALIGAFSRRLRRIQTGIFSYYGLVMALGALIIIGTMIFLK
ncbi:MAG TPA: NADH-quinone oxidoreductase subunit L [Nitrospirae bacterium]|nr:NADH-quinone oxidoreductase subunit L [bacterium BMS3Abin10]GBE37769.1 NADH-quinone oxidoreductase subunit L [bacterium BMS3Bbin08]HDH50470.1 NADH-quinone oxidoreductase subunit L [Nitrospirota bacterium]HDK82182.1 NADH-quinone oxidoreductase subunit L [Nitrospirota bacterium]